MALGASARRLSWGYFIYVAYYVVFAALLGYYGIRWSGTAEFTKDLVKHSSVLVSLVGYLVVNAGVGAGLRYYTWMPGAGRWCIAMIGILIAAISAGLYFWTVYKRGAFVGHASHLFGLVLASGYVLLAYQLIRITRALDRYVLVEGVWLPKRVR